MKIINIDKNGNVIPDLSKVVLPDHIQKKIIAILMRGELREQKNKALEAEEDKGLADKD